MASKEELLIDLEHGDSHERFMAALKFRKGEEVTRNLPIALVGFLKLADEDHEQAAQQAIEILLEGGIGVPRDPGRASILLKKLSGQGNCHAQYLLANRYMRGDGVPHDPGRSLELYHLAAQPRPGRRYGHVHATFLLMGMYVVTAWGKHKEPSDYMRDPDMRKAVRYARGLTGKGSAYWGRACYELGRYYQYGYGVRRSIGTALTLYRKAMKCPYTESAEAAEKAARAVARIKASMRIKDSMRNLPALLSLPRGKENFRYYDR